MTDFMYKNRKQLNQIGRECCGRGRKVENLKTEYFEVFIYAIAYCMFFGQRMTKYMYEKIKEMAKEQEENYGEDPEIRIFFEKVEAYEKDVLYFQEIMKKLENRSTFKTAYQAYLEKAA